MANRRDKVEAVTDFVFLVSEITAYGNCSLEIKRYFLLGRKAMTNLDSILKSRNLPLCLQRSLQSKVRFFPIVMYGCESLKEG